VWLAGIGVNLAVVGRLAVWGRHGPAGDSPRREASRPAAGAAQTAVLAAAAGAAFGLCAALMKGMTQTLSAGIGAALGGWQLYSMIAVGVLGMFLTQSAMNVGQLIAAQPGLTLSDPVISVLWGVLVFHERVRTGWFIAADVAAMAVIASAVVALARSPLLCSSLAGGAVLRVAGGCCGAGGRFLLSPRPRAASRGAS